MTPEQKALVRTSWARLQPESSALTTRFYERVFALNPNARGLFGSKDMHLQGMLFTKMLALFIRSLDDDEPTLIAMIEASGRRHVGYGVAYTDYDNVGAALLWSVEQSLGPAFTDDVRDAWAEAYRSLAAAMRRASSSIL